MAILKECQECGNTFYGERNDCLNCREKKRIDEAKQYSDWIDQYDNCYCKDDNGNWKQPKGDQMKKLILITLLLCPVVSSCAVGAATAAYSLKAQTADNLAAPERKSIIDEVKAWAEGTFEKKEEK